MKRGDVVLVDWIFSDRICNNLSTLDQSLIHRRMGELSPAALRQIEAKLKSALELP